MQQKECAKFRQSRDSDSVCDDSNGMKLRRVVDFFRYLVAGRVDVGGVMCTSTKPTGHAHALRAASPNFLT